MPFRNKASRPWWATTARLGVGAWFVANLYEGVVDVPRLLADAAGNRRPGLMSAGSPVRFFVPLGAVTLGSAAVTVAHSWKSRDDRRRTAAAAASVGAATAITGYLVRTANVPLLMSADLDTGKRDKLISRWHRGNALRLVLLGIGGVLLDR
ncbi:MAG TPA: DUF1772 domain-containing protein [Actinophytocola sp.]|jgi:hypothetical protein|nr:DUF1772 domain-containing protein [Actinophytocola sp.]